MDKLAPIKTVVNKTHTIDNTFRNFQMEVLAGEPDFITVAREHGVMYKLDFSKVYWNSRLGILFCNVCTHFFKTLKCMLYYIVNVHIAVGSKTLIIVLLLCLLRLFD